VVEGDKDLDYSSAEVHLDRTVISRQKAIEFRGGSVCLNRLLGEAKWISALVMPLPGLATAR
jgi:hypothetical protein